MLNMANVVDESFDYDSLACKDRWKVFFFFGQQSSPVLRYDVRSGGEIMTTISPRTNNISMFLFDVCSQRRA